MTWEVRFTETAVAALEAIKDMRERGIVYRRALDLAENPLAKGKPLVGDLAGCYSVRAGGQRYRIVYRCDNQTVIVTVIVVGIRKEGDRKDVYTVARRLVALALKEPPEKQ